MHPSRSWRRSRRSRLYSRQKALLIFANNPRFLNRVGDSEKDRGEDTRARTRSLGFPPPWVPLSTAPCVGLEEAIMQFSVSQPGTELPHIGTRTVQPCVQARSSPQRIGGEHED